MARYIALCCMAAIESRHRHDFIECPCGKTSVDGGDVYHRVAGRSMPVWVGPSLPLRIEE